MSNELAHALRMARERGARGILVDPTASALRFSRDEAWSEPVAFADARAVIAYIDEAVIGPQELEQAVRDQVAAGLRAMGYAIDDEPIASHSATLTIDGELVAVGATRLATGATLLTPMRWDDVPALAPSADLDRVLALSHGIVLVTGPDAPTRRSFVRSLVRALEPSTRRMFYITDEDEPALPSVLYRPGSPRSRVHRVREALRWDADGLVIAPIATDRAECEMATNAALTGHLTVVELPAADEASAIAAFTSSGIERFAFVPALAAVICVGPPPMFRIVDDAFRAQLS